MPATEDPNAAKLAIERLKARAEMRSSHEIEDSVVIQQKAEERLQASLAPKSESTPTGPGAWLVQPVVLIAKVVPGPQRIWVLLILATLAVFYGIGRARGWW